MKNGDADKDHELDLGHWIDDRLAARLPDGEWQPNATRGLARFQEQRTAKRPRIQRWAWVATGVIATSLSLAAFPVTRAIVQRGVSACVRESSRVREFLLGNAAGPAPSSTYVNSEDRKMAPNFTMTDASGKLVKLSDFRGKAVLLNFWATWCGPCKVEIPMLKGLQQTYQDRKFTVLGVSLEEEGWTVVKPYMERAQFNYPVTVGGEDIAALYGGLNSVPTTLLIDKSGRIASVHVGLCNRSEYEGEIKAVLQEQ
jgi:thiol-disulfide isomerase/thioredoxin